MEILFLKTLNSHWHKRIDEMRSEFSQHKFIINNNDTEQEECLKTADAVVSGKLPNEHIEGAKNLKIIFVPFTGLNSFPLELLKQKNILISNTHANANIVAERAISLALALLGRIVELHNDLKRGYWHMSIENDDMWTSIQNKSCGILGFGHIGSHLAKFLKAFTCKVYGYKRQIPKTLPENVDEISDNLMKVISNSDIIFNCLPLSDETRNIINDEVLSKMKDKYFINVGRGGTVDEDALYKSLTNGTLKGAAMDVWFNYPSKIKPEPVFPSTKPIYELPNVVLSPHKSSHTVEAINSMIDDTCDNIRKFILREEI